MCPFHLGDGRFWHLLKSFFWEAMEWSHTSVKLSSVLFNRCSMLLGKCFCRLQTGYTYLASGGFAPIPPLWVCPWSPLGDLNHQTHCAHPTSKMLAMPLCPICRMSRTNKKTVTANLGVTVRKLVKFVS